MATTGDRPWIRSWAMTDDIAYIPRPYRYVMGFMAALSMRVGLSPRLYLEPLVQHLQCRGLIGEDA